MIRGYRYNEPPPAGEPLVILGGQQCPIEHLAAHGRFTAITVIRSGRQ